MIQHYEDLLIGLHQPWEFNIDHYTKQTNMYTIIENLP